MFGLVFKEKNTFFKNCCARLNFDPFLTPTMTRTAAILPDFTEFCGGRTKPLYEAPDFNCHQISQSGHQIGGNLISKSKFVSIQFNFE